MKKGMTLLEILISLMIFSFASIYISRVLNKSLTQKKKIDKDIKEQRATSNILEILKQDLLGVLLSSDISSELRKLHPLPSSAPSLATPSFTRLSKVFDFQGTEDTLSFVTFSQNPASPKEYQLIKVDYFLKTCSSYNQKESSQCLIRGVSSEWEDIEDTSKRKTITLFENIIALEFSYYNSEKKEWQDDWDFLDLKKQILRKPSLNFTFLPSSIRLRQERSSAKNKITDVTFPVSHSFLRTYQTQLFSPFLLLEESTDGKVPPLPLKQKPRGRGVPDHGLDLK